tara:strand:- start:2061 stop:3548 length:1488 start_codon:yes stop_codon:yes gene_type:complete
MSVSSSTSPLAERNPIHRRRCHHLQRPRNINNRRGGEEVTQKKNATTRVKALQKDSSFSLDTLQEKAEKFVKHVKSYRITRVVEGEDEGVEEERQIKYSSEKSSIEKTTSAKSNNDNNNNNNNNNRRRKNDIETYGKTNEEEKYTLVCAQTYETDRETRDLVSVEIAQKGALLGSLMMEKVLEQGWWDHTTDMPSPGSAELAMDASPALEFQALKRQQRRDLNASVRQTIEKELGTTVDFNALVRKVIEKVFEESSGVLPNEIPLTKQMTEEILRDVCTSPKVSLYKNTLLYLSENEEEFAISSSRRDFSIQAEFEAKKVSLTNNNLHPLAVVTLSIIEDMSVSISEGITKAVLSTNAFGLVSNLKSSRILNKFRNQQRFSKFLFDNYRDVENIFSDRFELYGYYAETDQLIKRTLFMQRVNELEKLRGLRYFVSIVLEALDVFVPVLFQAWKNATKVATYLLVVVLGRSIGLVYRGIKDVVDDSINRNSGMGRF